jgi:hypothetical protein
MIPPKPYNYTVRRPISVRISSLPQSMKSRL